MLYLYFWCYCKRYQKQELKLMDHVAIMRKSWGLTQKILTGEKKIESRWYNVRYAPWDKIEKGDMVYFKDSGTPVTLRTRVQKVLQFSISHQQIWFWHHGFVDNNWRSSVNNGTLRTRSMSDYYSGKRTRGLFDPASKDPFVISRSKLDLFMKCQRCFYLDVKLGVGQPPGYPFTLNTAVDTLLKKEFDIHRAANTTHPLMKVYGIDAVPFADIRIEEWRDARTRGIKFFHKPSNLILRGGVDDVWQNSRGELHIVDYKATSKNSEVNLDAEWQQGYKRQMEIYQWLFRQNGFKVSNIGYFVYVNGKTDRKAFDGKLEFDVMIISYEGDDSWVEGALQEVKQCLTSDKLPSASADCDFCTYRKAVQDALEPFTK